MGFYYAIEKRRFDAAWLKLEKDYRSAGFDEAGIQAMREFDLELFRKRRSIENRENALPSFNTGDGDDDSCSALLVKFGLTSVSFDFHEGSERFSWIEKINNFPLYEKLGKLSNEDKELLTLLIFDGFTQVEIAKMRGSTKQAVNQRIKKIKKLLKPG